MFKKTIGNSLNPDYTVHNHRHLSKMKDRLLLSASFVIFLEKRASNRTGKLIKPYNIKYFGTAVSDSFCIILKLKIFKKSSVQIPNDKENVEEKLIFWLGREILNKF